MPNTLVHLPCLRAEAQCRSTTRSNNWRPHSGHSGMLSNRNEQASIPNRVKQNDADEVAESSRHWPAG
ncbi:hypothetical protein IG631_19876 [Alternaria alternata]|nr:hypothetical protein IG631_19876 [Alternaria alternata]